MEIFKQRCEKKSDVELVKIMEGFNEISPLYKEIFIDLLQAVRQTALEQLWVTTRLHLREEIGR